MNTRAERRVRPYFIGDIHGCYQELLELEEKIQRHAEQAEVTPLIVSVGDLVDRGPDSAAVVAHFIQGGYKKTHHAIMGNHEVMMIQVLEEFLPERLQAANCQYPLGVWSLKELHEQEQGAAMNMDWESYRIHMLNMWVNQGGRETLESYDMDATDMDTWTFSEEVLRYLMQLPLYWESAEGVVTHALPRSEDLDLIKAAEAQEIELNEANVLKYKTAGNMLLWNRSLPFHAPDAVRQHISGHTPMPRMKRHRLQNCVQIDTGCVFGRKLTAYCLENGHSLSVQAHYNYTKR